MPFKSVAQQRYLESKASPLSAKQKKEWAGATDFSKLPARAGKTTQKSAPSTKKR